MKEIGIKVTVLDINSSMLEEGKKRAQEMGLTSDRTHAKTQRSSSSVPTPKNFHSRTPTLMPTLFHLD